MDVVVVGEGTGVREPQNSILGCVDILSVFNDVALQFLVTSFRLPLLNIIIINIYGAAKPHNGHFIKF